MISKSVNESALESKVNLLALIGARLLPRYGESVIDRKEQHVPSIGPRRLPGSGRLPRALEPLGAKAIPAGDHPV